MFVCSWFVTGDNVLRTPLPHSTSIAACRSQIGRFASSSQRFASYVPPVAFAMIRHLCGMYERLMQACVESNELVAGTCVKSALRRRSQGRSPCVCVGLTVHPRSHAPRQVVARLGVVGARRVSRDPSCRRINCGRLPAESRLRRAAGHSTSSFRTLSASRPSLWCRPVAPASPPHCRCASPDCTRPLTVGASAVGGHCGNPSSGCPYLVN